MQKIAIIGAGNVGGQIALSLIGEGAAHLALLDVADGLAKGKALDLEDAASVLKRDCRIEAGSDFSLLKDAGIIVVTAGLARRPGMSRDDLLKKNSEIIKDISPQIKKYAVNPIVIVITNPVDLMTYLAAEATGFDKSRVFGMGANLDGARFANLIHNELQAPVSHIEAVVIGSHGQAMVPAPYMTKVSGARLERLVDKKILGHLVKSTVERGASIVAHLGSGSAYFGPAAAAACLVRAIVKDEKRIIGACAYVNGEYGIKGLYIGVPARIGKDGVEGIIELELNAEERAAFLASAESIRRQIEQFANV